jgi:hypothetical protein
MSWNAENRSDETDLIVREIGPEEAVEAGSRMGSNADQSGLRFHQTGAADRAEATALLIRCGYGVYYPENGEDLVVRSPSGELRAVQLEKHPIVDWKRYGARRLWMLFPSASYDHSSTRVWFLILHDHFYDWVERRHLSTPKWASYWRYPVMSQDLRTFLTEWELMPPGESPWFSGRRH